MEVQPIRQRLYENDPKWRAGITDIILPIAHKNAAANANHSYPTLLRLSEVERHHYALRFHENKVIYLYE
jgi:hypothetical protein